METVWVAGIFALGGAAVGGVINQLGGWLNKRKEEQRAIRNAKADRLSKMYGSLVVAAWNMHDFADSGSWTRQRPTSWADDERAANMARAQLVLEEGTKRQCWLHKEIGKCFFRWDNNRQFAMQNTGHDATLTQDMIRDEELIDKYLNELEELMQCHVTTLRETFDSEYGTAYRQRC